MNAQDAPAYFLFIVSIFLYIGVKMSENKVEKKDETFTVGPVVIVKETAKALLCDLAEEGGEPVEVWFPKSQIHITSEVDSAENHEGDLIVTEWIAREKGLIQ